MPDSTIAARPAAFVIVHPSGNRTRTPIDHAPFSIGRQADNSLVLRDNRASRQHARILIENGEYVLEDLNSRHGTFVNGERATRRVLTNSDKIEFGVPDSYTLVFTLEEDEIHRILEQMSATSRSNTPGA